MKAATEGKAESKGRFILLYVVSLGLFIIGLAACYQGAVRGKLWLGPATVAVVCIFQILVSAKRWKKELSIILLSGVIGLALETILLMCGVYSAAEKTRWFLPAPLSAEWILALWINFGGKVSSLLPMMRGKPVAVGFSSIIFALMIFTRAAKLELVGLTWGWGSIAIIAVGWAIAVPLLFRLAEKLIPPTEVSSVPKA